MYAEEAQEMKRNLLDRATKARDTWRGVLEACGEGWAVKM